MDQENKKTIILHRAIDILRKNTGLTAEIEPNPQYIDYAPDAVIRIAWQDLECFYDAEIKNVINRAALGGVVRKLDLFHRKGILVAKYITPPIADELKKMDIPFMDTVGNVYINEPPLFIFIKGNKLEGIYHKDTQTRAFRPAGLQVIFALLCNPGLENTTFREIAEKANVALGTINWVMRDLKKLDYLIELPQRKRKLTRKKDLINRWVTTYPELLRQKKMIGLYQADDQNWWEHTDIQDFNVLWGGEVAAAWLTEYLKPQKITIYTDRPVGRFLLKNRLKKDPNGNTELLEVFWNFEIDWPHRNMVPPLLIYADLLATGDARNIETARIIYEREFDRFLRED